MNIDNERTAIIKAEINDKIEKITEIDKKLSKKNDEVSILKESLEEAEKEYNEAHTEEKKNIFSQQLKMFNNVYDEYNNLQKKYKNLIDELDKYISLNENELKNELKNNPELVEVVDELKIFIENFKKAILAEEKKEETAIEEAAGQGGGKRKSKGKSKKVAKKPVVSQKKQSIYKEIFGKQMKIYKMPDSRKEYVKYKGELLHISDYKDLMKQKAIAKTKTKVTKVTQKKAKSKTKK